MKEIITTTDIQILEIALIYYKTDKSRSNVMSDKEYDRLMEILNKMNHLCTDKNDYSLEMEIKERRED